MLKLEEPIAFYAGQYINVLLEDGAKRSFSFATAPQVNDRIELHIRRIPGGRFTGHVFESMRPGERLAFEGPLGSFFLREDSDKPMIFVAGSTGFAPVKSMLEYAFASGLRRRMFLYWGVRRGEDLYLGELPREWERSHANFRFVPVLSEPDARWTGRRGLVHEAILADFPDLAGYQVYACGSAAMVEAAHPAFRARGLTEDDFGALVPRLEAARAEALADAESWAAGKGVSADRVEVRAGTGMLTAVPSAGPGMPTSAEAPGASVTLALPDWAKVAEESWPGPSTTSGVSSFEARPGVRLVVIRVMARSFLTEHIVGHPGGARSRVGRLSEGR